MLIETTLVINYPYYLCPYLTHIDKHCWFGVGVPFPFFWIFFFFLSSFCTLAAPNKL